jgi:hypothetical protein
MLIKSTYLMKYFNLTNFNSENNCNRLTARGNSLSHHIYIYIQFEEPKMSSNKQSSFVVMSDFEYVFIIPEIADNLFNYLSLDDAMYLGRTSRYMEKVAEDQQARNPQLLEAQWQEDHPPVCNWAIKMCQNEVSRNHGEKERKAGEENYFWDFEVRGDLKQLLGIKEDLSEEELPKPDIPKFKTRWWLADHEPEPTEDDDNDPEEMEFWDKDDKNVCICTGPWPDVDAPEVIAAG